MESPSKGNYWNIICSLYRPRFDDCPIVPKWVFPMCLRLDSHVSWEIPQGVPHPISVPSQAHIILKFLYDKFSKRRFTFLIWVVYIKSFKPPSIAQFSYLHSLGILLIPVWDLFIHVDTILESKEKANPTIGIKF